jgi:hypothetical protein
MFVFESVLPATDFLWQVFLNTMSKQNKLTWKGGDGAIRKNVKTKMMIQAASPPLQNFANSPGMTRSHSHCCFSLAWMPAISEGERITGRKSG